MGPVVLLSQQLSPGRATNGGGGVSHPWREGSNPNIASPSIHWGLGAPAQQSPCGVCIHHFQGSAFPFQAVLVTGATEVQGRKVRSRQNCNGSGKPEQKERQLTRCATFTALQSPRFAFFLL